MTRILHPLIAFMVLLATLFPIAITGAPLEATRISHTVVHGDTLYSLARRYSTTIEAIVLENGISGTTIYVGQKLWIPSSSSQPPTQNLYVVIRGDTLYSIARRYGSTVDAIMAANDLSGPLIYVGQRLVVPSNLARVPSATLQPLPSPSLTATPSGTLVATATPTHTFTPTPTATTVTSAPCPCDADTLNCSNFTTQPQAQACQDYCESIGRGDIHNLDGDADTVACEDLPPSFNVIQ